MRCDDFHQRVNELLDQRVDPSTDTVVRRHVARCAQCSSQLAGYRALHAYFSPSPTSQNATVDQSSNWLYGLVTAAILLLAVSFGWQADQSPSLEIASTEMLPPVRETVDVSRGNVIVQL